MNLWIRTQDKSSLLGVKSIWIEPVAKIGIDKNTVQKHSLNAETNADTNWLLGSFSTKVAALAELDRIEWWIANGGAQDVYQVGQAEPPGGG